MNILFSLLAKYHQYRVVGLENVPKAGTRNFLFVGNHSFATYDSFLFAWKVHRETGRTQGSVVDKLFFKAPLISQFAKDMRWIPGVTDEAVKHLRDGGDMWVLPGGMREALRPSSERRKVVWGHQKGFIRLSLKAQVPIVLFACPAADNIFTVYSNPATPWLYDKLSLPLPIVRGLGLSAVPRPVPLTTFVAEPISPPQIEEAEPNEEEIDQFHLLIASRMDELLLRR